MTKEFFERGKQIAKWADNNMTKDEALALSEKQHTFPDKKQPAQEPVAWVKDGLICPENGYETTRTEQHPKDLGWTPLYISQQARLLQEPIAVCKDSIVNWVNGKAIDGWLYTHPAQQPAQQPVSDHEQYMTEARKAFGIAPSWQGNKEFVGLSDDEKLAIIRKWKDEHTMRAQELIGLGDAFEQALKEKNNAV